MLQTFFQNSTQQVLTKYSAQLQKINSIGNLFSTFSDKQLQEKTLELKKKLEETNDQSTVINEAFALVREATHRVLKIKHFDVQLIGGLVLNEGKIAEMKTGEGKTIVALLPTFLNALHGNGTHVVTVNDYLAKRDAEYVGEVHRFLGLTVGLIQENMTPEERKQNYDCDVVYVTNNELGFDYLRDNMAFTRDEIVQRPFFYAVVDEVDSILIDEARTPLIISGPSEAPTEKYLQTSKLANILKRDIHYSVDEKNQNVVLLEGGITFCEQALGIPDLYNPSNPWISYILNSVKAKELFKINTNYIINEEGEIVIVDEFTGRTMYGRRWSDGLHQAVEAKENVRIQDESQTLASITYQNLFLLYDKLSGMTGTSKTEELEFEKIYSLRVVQIPTHRPIKRRDFPDLIYKNQYIKWQAIANECVEMYNLGRPVLVGTTTIEKSELLAALLSEYKVPYRLLNARPENVESESEIVAQAGCKNAVTIATNMAGRGTDIMLGGNVDSLTITALRKLFDNDIGFSSTPYPNLSLEEILGFNDAESFNNLKQNYKKLVKDLLDDEKAGRDASQNPIYKGYKKIWKEKTELAQQAKEEVLALGGLHVIGTERHESRRIDNQLRGRSGRQGDPGSSRFFLSLEDKLLRLFGGDQVLGMMQNIGFQDTTPIQSPLLNQSLESAQKKVEAYYFDTRKQLFEYDQALTMQRNGVYTERKRVLQKENVRDWIVEYAERSLYDLILYSKNVSTEEGIESLNFKLQELLGTPFQLFIPGNRLSDDALIPFLQQQFQISYDLKETEIESIESGLMRELERSFLLQQIDFSWKEHLQKISFLRDSIKWRAYGQKDPLTEYKKEAFNFFVTMLTRIRHRVVYFVLRSKIVLEV